MVLNVLNIKFNMIAFLNVTTLTSFVFVSTEAGTYYNYVDTITGNADGDEELCCTEAIVDQNFLAFTYLSKLFELKFI